jgi:hypothetical protein
MQLVEQRRFDIDDPVVKYIPEFTLADQDAAKTLNQRRLVFSGAPEHGDRSVPGMRPG